jgi:hypothetical protein
MKDRLDIGFITSGYRTLKDGREFDRFFGTPDGNDRVVREGNVFETIDLMKKVVWKYIGDTKKIAAYLKGATLKQTCENTWNFLYHHIQYKLDERGMEQLRRPNRSWAERKTGIDCDCFSIFVSSILTNLQIPHSFRITKYNRDSYQHVYVIVPAPRGQYIIDCVVGRFNYEKPYTANKDFPMSLDKINIAVLSGTETDVMDVIAGLDGLDDELSGAVSEAQRSQVIFDHLVKTRNLIAQKPYLIAQVDYPPAFIQMLDYAIAAWHTPHRTAALENLARNEEALNRMSGMDGVPDETELDGTDDVWSHLDGLALGELNGRRRKKHKKGFFRRIGQAVKRGVQKGVKALVRFNPLSIAARNGFLLAMKLNIKKMASRLKWGYATREQAAAKRISTKQWERSKKALAKVEKLFADKLQGKRSALKNAILKGRAKGINGLGGPEEETSLQGLGIVPAAALAAAAPLIAAALKIMSGEGLMKNDEAQSAEAAINAKASEADIPATDASVPVPVNETTPAPVATYTAPVTPSPDEMVISPPQRIPDSPEPENPEESPSQDNSENVPAIAEEAAPVEESPEVTDAEPENDGSYAEASAAPPEVENTEDSTIDGIFDFVQSKPLLIAGGIGLGIWGLSWLLSRNKGPSGKGLGGLSPGKKKKKKKTPSRHSPRKKAGRKTVRAITLR